MTTDMHDIRQERILASEHALNKRIEEVSIKYGVMFNLQQSTQVILVHFDELIVALVKAVAEENPTIHQQSDGKVSIPKPGFFHDAMKFGETIPALMIFVPSVGGISHDKAEFMHP